MQVILKNNILFLWGIAKRSVRLFSRTLDKRGKKVWHCYSFLVFASLQTKSWGSDWS